MKLTFPDIFIWIILFGGSIFAFAAFVRLSAGCGYGGLEPIGDSLLLVQRSVRQPEVQVVEVRCWIAADLGVTT